MPAAPFAGNNAAGSKHGGPSGLASAGAPVGPGPSTQLCTGGIEGTGAYWLPGQGFLPFHRGVAFGFVGRWIPRAALAEVEVSGVGDYSPGN